MGTFWSWIAGAVTALANLLLLIGLGALVISLLLFPVGRYLARPRARPWRLQRWFGPALQVRSFDDSAMTDKLGTAFAGLTQARVGGGREGGMHLYLVTGEQTPDSAMAQIQTVPQTQVLAAALLVLQIAWGRTRLVATGSLLPADDSGAAAVAMCLRRNSTVIERADFWPSEAHSESMSAATSNRVLAVAAGAWIEHNVVDQTPGPRAREVLLSHDPSSWALFRAGAELSRMSHLREAADHYERALTIDPQNIGALIDLAHLRRRDGYYEGAELLARRACNMIERRNQTYRRPDLYDANWYRAHIVLATIAASWAKAIEFGDEPRDSKGPDGHRAAALKEAGLVAKTAIRARRELEKIFPDTVFEQSALGVEVPRGVRERAREAFSDTLPAFESGWAGRLVELHALLERTFEPAALLLIAGNCSRRHREPPQERDSERSETQLGEIRTSAEDAIDHIDDVGPNPLIEYVRAPPHKGPRVVYNLACYYAVAAEKADTDATLGEDAQTRAPQEAYLWIAAEYLRQSIARSPPLERRGLLEFAERDYDLESLRELSGMKLHRLWDMVPPDERPMGRP